MRAASIIMSLARRDPVVRETTVALSPLALSLDHVALIAPREDSGIGNGTRVQIPLSSRGAMRATFLARSGRKTTFVSRAVLSVAGAILAVLAGALGEEAAAADASSNPAAAVKNAITTVQKELQADNESLFQIGQIIIKPKTPEPKPAEDAAQRRAAEELKFAQDHLKLAEAGLKRAQAAPNAAAAQVEFRDALDKAEQARRWKQRAESVIAPPPVAVASVAPPQTSTPAATPATNSQPGPGSAAGPVQPPGGRSDQEPSLPPPRRRLTFGDSSTLNDLRGIHGQDRGFDAAGTPDWQMLQNARDFDARQQILTTPSGVTVDVSPVSGAVSALTGDPAIGNKLFVPAQLPDAHFALAMVATYEAKELASSLLPDRDQLAAKKKEVFGALANAVRLDPTYGRAYLFRAGLYAAFGEAQKALDDLRQAQKLVPGLDPRLEASIRAGLDETPTAPPAEPASPPARKSPPIRTPPPDSAQARQTLALLDVVKRALREYLNQNGEYPAADSSTLTKKLSGFLQLDRRNVDRQGRILDAWGRPVVYQGPSPGTVRLYSSGPNGRDEDGAGDDIVLPDK